jgi:hypothetical protein
MLIRRFPQTTLYLAIAIVIAIVFVPAASAEDLAKTRTVSGHQIVHYKDAPVPVDLSQVTIAAYVPNGSGYNVITGTGTTQGTFTISGVPTGNYLLQFGVEYLWTNASKVNLDTNSDYRSTVVPANSDSTLTFDILNLNAWQDTDVFEIVCPNNLSWESTDDYLYGGMSSGATSFTGTYPYVGNLSEASLKDQYYVADLVTQEVSNIPMPALARYYAVPKFTQAQDSNTSINGTLKAIAQTNTLEGNANGADLANEALAANPGAILADMSFGFDVYPGSLSKGFTTDAPDLILYEGYSGGPPILDQNGDIGPIAYGNPYPKSWPLFVIYEYDAATFYTAPGASNSASLTTSAYGYTTTLPTATSPIVPLVGVVQNPNVNGTSFFANQTGAGVAPTLTWSAPSVGTATFYRVRVNLLSNNGGNSTFTTVAVLSTQETSLQIPPGVLTAGQAYVFLINARYTSGLNFAKNPYFLGPSAGYAGVVSGMIQP